MMSGYKINLEIKDEKMDEILKLVREKIKSIQQNGLHGIDEELLVKHLIEKGYNITKRLSREDIFSQLKDELQERGKYKCKINGLEWAVYYNTGGAGLIIENDSVNDSLLPQYFTQREAEEIIERYCLMLKEAK